MSKLVTLYKWWSIVTFPTPAGGHFALVYRPGVVPEPQAEAGVTGWRNTEAEAVESGCKKIDQLISQDSSPAESAEVEA